MSASPLTFEVVGHPEPAGSKRTVPNSGDWRSRPGVTWKVLDANPKADGWKKVVRQVAEGAMLKERRAMIDVPVWMSVVFRVHRPAGHFLSDGVSLSAEGKRNPYPAKKPDALKLARAVEDALTSIVYHDDAQIVSEQIRKEWGEVEGVAVTILPLAGEESEPTPEGGFRVIANHTICHLYDRPHSDRSGCPTCRGVPAMCIYGSPV